MISSGLSPAPDFVSSNFCLKSERFGRLSLTLRSSDFELSRSRRSTTRGFMASNAGDVDSFSFRLFDDRSKVIVGVARAFGCLRLSLKFTP
ncbi:hypothetical protein DY000_02007817 [Brassica cretica]|uniref:Uncharacterized protein n=1 Tax=Brassica cretica TaxID=69181 RepID=A0ABQ7C4Q4_BRACR|nr:hypothetical protein DY000_02007817 [Brassica cretica]